MVKIQKLGILNLKFAAIFLAYPTVIVTEKTEENNFFEYQISNFLGLEKRLHWNKRYVAAIFIFKGLKIRNEKTLYVHCSA